MTQNTQNKSRKWFTGSGWSKQANIYHTYGWNEVTLVWGSLRLAAITPLSLMWFMHGIIS